MKIYIMRHGEAEHFAQSDDMRQLTARGQRDSSAVAKQCVEQGLAPFNNIPFDKVLVSPYIRAQQTWAAVQEHWTTQSLETCQDITPYGQSDQVFDYVHALIDVEKLEQVLLISHLPLVGYLTAEFVTDIAPPMFSTSAIVCIEYDPATQQGELLWQATA